MVRKSLLRIVLAIVVLAIVVGVRSAERHRCAVAVALLDALVLGAAIAIHSRNSPPSPRRPGATRIVCVSTVAAMR